MADFKVGDRVKVTNYTHYSSHENYNGLTGTVIEIRDTNTWPITLRIDDDTWYAREYPEDQNDFLVDPDEIMVEE